MKVRFSVLDSVITEPIKRGEVVPEGIELEVFHPKTTDANSRDMLELRYDVAEMSIATFVRAVEQGLGLAALPVFGSGRRFVQSGFYFSRSSGPSNLGAIVGRKVGLPQYWISSCMWQRLALKQMYGIEPRDVRWVSVEPERFEGLDVPSGVELCLDAGRTLADLMEAGEIDACLLQGARVAPPDLAAVSVPAYEDAVAAEREYYRKSGILPIVHLTVMRRELAESRPEVVPALLDAYGQAKALAERCPDAVWPLPPIGHDIEGLRQLTGGDPFAYGLSPNRRVFETFLEAALDQGLIARHLSVDELFVDDLPEQYQ